MEGRVQSQVYANAHLAGQAAIALFQHTVAFSHTREIGCFIIIYTRVTADCSASCENGGWCYTPDYCNCTAGWSGQNCSAGKDL